MPRSLQARPASGTTADRLTEEMDALRLELSLLVESAPIARYDNSGSVIVATWPDFYFESLRGSALAQQAELKRRWLSWRERFLLLFPDPPEDLQQSLDDALDSVSNWIELGRSYEIGKDKGRNAELSEAAWLPMVEFLQLFDGPRSVIIVPDTNSLVTVQDPVEYRPIAGRDTFTFLLLPTVLAELDELKVRARDPDFRSKVKKVIGRIKGWRGQGPLLSGVTIHNSITVKAIAAEPKMSATLSWLSPDNRDDRIVASVLECQSAFPSSACVLVTGDVNLQNKCDAASLDCYEPPAA